MTATTLPPPTMTVASFAVIADAWSDCVFAASSIGLLRSDDGGATWGVVGSSGAGSIESVAVSPAFWDDRALCVGNETGVVRSLDGGMTWAAVLSGSPTISLALANDRAGERIVLAGTTTDGIFRSANSGADWVSANPGLFELEILALGASPEFATDKTVLAGTPSGLYRSRNGGLAWRPLDLPLADTVVQCLAISPAFASDGGVLAGSEADGLFRSGDGGKTWDIVGDLGQTGITALIWSPRASGVIAAATAEGVALSEDSGVSWRLGSDPGPVLTLAFADGADGEALLAGMPDLGIRRSLDRGLTWEDAIVSPAAGARLKEAG